MPLVQILKNNALTALAGLPKEMSVGVGVFGPAAAYALVWELGSKRLKKPGPKTVWGVNRFKQKRIFSSQAPKGYVYINLSAAQKIMSHAVSTCPIDINDLQTSKVRLEVAMDNAAQEIANMIAQDAPVDSGDLRAGIAAIYSDESEFLDLDSDQGTLML